MDDVLHGENWRLYRGDCLEVLRPMAMGWVDAVITDPPYMIGASSIGDANSKAGSWVDLMNASFWYREWMAGCWRVLRDGGYLVVFLNWRSMPMMFKACADAGIPAHSLAVWDKEWIGPAGPSQLRPTYELILFCGKGSARIDDRGQADIFRQRWSSAHMGQSGHPAQKPVPLIKRIIELVTKRGEAVLDPFAGSGTTGVAAMQAGRAFVGIEGADKYFSLAAERISAAVNPLGGMV